MDAIGGTIVGACLGWLLLVASASAQPPSQALATDPSPPVHVFATRVDVVRAWRREAALQLDAAFHPAHALWAVAGWTLPRGGGPLLGLGYRVRPLARGLAGPAVGLDVVLRSTGRGRGRTTLVEAGFEAGYDAVFRGVCLGFALGLRVGRSFAQGATRGPTVAPRVALRIGPAFR